MKPLENKTALVTGASRGIGRAIAERLAADGAKVIVHYNSSRAAAEEVVAAIQKTGRSAYAVPADLGSAAGPAKLFEQVTEPLDILVNNAGVAPFADILETSEETLDQILNVNVRSVFLVTKHALRQLRDGGRIINLSSAVTRTVFPGITAYSASKGFVDTLTLHLGGTLGARGITVNAVAPGVISTEMSAPMIGAMGEEGIKSTQALKRIGQPEDIARIVSFLAGPEGGWVTGQVIDGSGGTKL